MQSIALCNLKPGMSGDCGIPRNSYVLYLIADCPSRGEIVFSGSGEGKATCKLSRCPIHQFSVPFLKGGSLFSIRYHHVGILDTIPPVSIMPFSTLFSILFFQFYPHLSDLTNFDEF